MYNVNRCSPTLTNCTFSGNSAGFGGGMVFYYYGNPIVTNCVLGGDSWAEIIVVEVGPEDEWPVLTLTYSDVQGEYWPGSNIYADPLFVDADGADNIAGTADDNLRLSAGSPCIDAGDNTSIPFVIWTDLDGKKRIIDDPATPDTGNGIKPIVDMGAYEFGICALIPGDFDARCGVDFIDFAVFALAWHTQEGEPGWNPACDISIPPDSHIDWRDLDVFTVDLCGEFHGRLLGCDSLCA